MDRPPPEPSPAAWRVWLEAARPRTLPLAVACIMLGAFLAGAAGVFRPAVVALALLTAVCLQVLSNLANDYGDSVHGADASGRVGPRRAVAAGLVPATTMRRALIVAVAASAATGLALLLVAAWGAWERLLVFLGLGAAAVAAAVLYTNGRRPYGYAGLGDVAVLLFFGWAGVLGTYALQAGDLPVLLWLPATSCGLLAVAVLNVNNLRDRASDAAAGKQTIPVRFGPIAARRYHLALLSLAFLLAVLYVALAFASYGQWLFLITLPRFVRNGRDVYAAASPDAPPQALLPLLPRTALLALMFALAFGLGQVI